MKAIDFLNKLKNKKRNSGSGKWINKERYLWYHIRENYDGEKKPTLYLRPVKLDKAIGYYGKIGKNFRIIPISEQEYEEIWKQIHNEKKLYGKQKTPSPVIRFVYWAVLPHQFPENKTEEDKLVIVECSRTEFDRLVNLEKEILEGDFKEYFESVEKTPEEMQIVIKRYYTNDDKVAKFSYVIKATAKGIVPVCYEIDEEDFEKDMIDLRRYYSPENKLQEDIEIEEVMG